MSFQNPQIEDIQDLVRAEMSQILAHVGGNVGAKIGGLQKQLNNLAGLDLAQITQIQSNVQALYDALDGDPASAGFQNLQSLLSLISRVVDLEAWKATVDSRLTNAEDGVAGIDDRISALETTTTQQIADLGVDVAAANSNAASALSTANAAQVAISLLDSRENGRHNGHENAIGILRQQVYAQHVGLAALAINAFDTAFMASEAAALLP